MSKQAVLIVDDEEELCRLVGIQLTGLDVTVETVYKPSEALNLIEKKEFQLVITDGRLPEMHGFELVKKIKESTNTPPKVFMMTGYNDYTDQEAKKAGVDKVYLKPGDLKNLVDDTKLFFETIV